MEFDTQLGRIFQEALDAEIAGDQALSFVWRRLLFAMARDVYGLRVMIKPVFAVAEPARQTIMFADDLLDGIRAAIREPYNKDAQLLPREFSLHRGIMPGFNCEVISLISPDGKYLAIVGIDTSTVTDITEIRIAIRRAKMYNTKTKPSKSKNKQLSLQPRLLGA